MWNRQLAIENWSMVIGIFSPDAALFPTTLDKLPPGSLPKEMAFPLRGESARRGAGKAMQWPMTNFQCPIVNIEILNLAQGSFHPNCMASAKPDLAHSRTGMPEQSPKSEPGPGSQGDNIRFRIGAWRSRSIQTAHRVTLIAQVNRQPT